MGKSAWGEEAAATAGGDPPPVPTRQAPDAPPAEFVHLRHQPAWPGPGARELIVACPTMRSGVNLARIVRAAGCCGVRRMIVAGSMRIDPKVARDALEQIQIARHRTLLPVLRKLRAEGYRLVGLEQAQGSVSIYDYRFPRRAVLLIGHERLGITPDLLPRLDEVVEIPIFGRPQAHNAATAAAIAMHEYCRQWGAEAG